MLLYSDTNLFKVHVKWEENKRVNWKITPTDTK